MMMMMVVVVVVRGLLVCFMYVFFGFGSLCSSATYLVDEEALKHILHALAHVQLAVEALEQLLHGALHLREEGVDQGTFLQHHDDEGTILVYGACVCVYVYGERERERGRERKRERE